MLGTEKQTGLYVYDLDGAALQYLPVGPLNNVDLRQAGPDGRDIAVASNDGVNEVSIFTVSRETGEVAYLGGFPTGRNEPYGICLGLAEAAYMPIVTYKDGTVQVFSLTVDGEGVVQAREVRTVKLASQLEGCVVDEFHQRLFIGEEAVGIWSLDLADPESVPVQVDTIFTGNGLSADVEGLTLWKGQDGKGWLVASAQGANRFVVYEREAPHRAMGVFRPAPLTGEGSGIIVDGVSETDGLDVRAVDLGPGRSRGLLVVQDGHNTDPRANQNFKYLDWSAIETALGLPLIDADPEG